MSNVLKKAEEKINTDEINKIKKDAENSKNEVGNAMKDLVNKNSIVITATSSIIVNILGFLFLTMVWNKQDEYALMKKGKTKYMLMKSFIMLIYVALNLIIVFLFRLFPS